MSSVLNVSVDLSTISIMSSSQEVPEITDKSTRVVAPLLFVFMLVGLMIFFVILLNKSKGIVHGTDDTTCVSREDHQASGKGR